MTALHFTLTAGSISAVLWTAIMLAGWIIERVVAASVELGDRLKALDDLEGLQ